MKTFLLILVQYCSNSTLLFRACCLLQYLVYGCTISINNTRTPLFGRRSSNERGGGGARYNTVASKYLFRLGFCPHPLRIVLLDELFKFHHLFSHVHLFLLELRLCTVVTHNVHQDYTAISAKGIHRHAFSSARHCI